MVISHDKNKVKNQLKQTPPGTQMTIMTPVLIGVWAFFGGLKLQNKGQTGCSYTIKKTLPHDFKPGLPSYPHYESCLSPSDAN